MTIGITSFYVVGGKRDHKIRITIFFIFGAKFEFIVSVENPTNLYLLGDFNAKLPESGTKKPLNDSKKPKYMHWLKILSCKSPFGEYI